MGLTNGCVTSLSNLSSTQSLPPQPIPILGTVFDQEHKERNKDGTIGIRMNEEQTI